VFLRLICLFVCFQGTWRPDEQRRPGVRRSQQREARRGGSSSDCCSIFSALVYLLVMVALAGPIRFVLEPWTSGGRQTSSDGLARRVGPDGWPARPGERRQWGCSGGQTAWPGERRQGICTNSFAGTGMLPVCVNSIFNCEK